MLNPVRKTRRLSIFLVMAVVFTIVISGCSRKADTAQVYPVINNQMANAYIVADHGEAVVIDPSDHEKIISLLKQKSLNLKFIILTHGHFDHILGLDQLAQEFPHAKVLMHPLELEKLSDPEKNLSVMFGIMVKSSVKSFPIQEKEIIKIGNTKIQIIETPGHTKGSISLLTENSLFSGDTLFKGSIGRTDFPDSSRNDLDLSLKKIVSLSNDLKIYPGHGEVTSMKKEEESNPYLKQLD